MKRKYTAEQKRRWRRNRKRHLLEFVLAYKREHPCVDCGEGDIERLTFDHVRGKKEFNIHEMVHRRLSKDRIRAEIEKCEVRCKECHRKRHNFSRQLRNVLLDIGTIEGRIHTGQL